MSRIPSRTVVVGKADERFGAIAPRHAAASVVHEIAEPVPVFNRGAIVERGAQGKILANPREERTSTFRNQGP